ncbi:putative cytochrome P450 E-class, group IV [Podospora fimiseda]|uniref:Cytochrome P450 E-class, group IV n=1 Tax=Podospora fimiseda TaxID=252190 RepID=A0AAN6YKG8_9PEZI|nr:putative cytochrome P450 E-class, group IV [Podospora fimiseda]
MLLTTIYSSNLGNLLLSCISLAVIFFFLNRLASISKWFFSSPWHQSPLSLLKRRARAWAFLFRGTAIIEEEYTKADGNPFFVEVPENRYLIVSSWKHVKEIDSAPEHVLSLQGAAKELLQPKHTMSKFNWMDKRGAEGVPLIRTLRVMLTSHLPEVLPDIRRSLNVLMDDTFESLSTKDGKTVTAKLYPMVIKGIAYSNALAFFGEEFAKNEKFMKAGMDFIEQTLLIAEILRLLPKTLSEPVGRFLSSKLNSSQVLFETLLPVAQQRVDERERAKLGQKVPQHKDCIQWTMESAPKATPWSAERIVYELIALWFGSVHITSTTACFAIHDLCLHLEYIEPLRKEIESTGWEAFTQSGGKSFPLLDSFMKESARLTPVESVSTRRMALEPFHLSDGSGIVQPGEWICTAARGMMMDSSVFANPNEFQGFRFVDPLVLEKLDSNTDTLSQQNGGDSVKTNFTDIADWQLWGTGRCACPGRYYAAAVMKTMLGLFVTKYDMKLTDPDAVRYFSWRTFIYPFPGTKVTLSRR